MKPGTQSKDPNLIEFIINDQLVFEMIKLEIRGMTIPYSVYRKKRDKKEKQLENEIMILQEQLDSSP